MSITPKISVVVPVYNTEPYLKECLDSIVNQSLSDIEIIIVNDGSPDHSIDIIREYEKQDSRIVVIDKQNEGVGKARNDGMFAAHGEYVAFIDSDDYYLNKNVLKKIYENGKKNQVMAVGGTHSSLDEDGTITRMSTCDDVYGMQFDAIGLCNYADYQFDYGFWTFVFNREMLLQRNILSPSYKRFQDPPFFVKAMTAAGKFYRMDESVYVYRSIQLPEKHSVVKTLDMMKGIEDNLIFSRENGLAKLHCLTAHRLDHEASYMIIKNLDQSGFDELLLYFVRVLSAIDLKWLKSEGYSMPEPFVPELFQYLRDTTRKYEQLRKNKVLSGIAKVIKTGKNK